MFEKYKGQVITVTGGYGFIGQHLRKALLHSGVKGIYSSTHNQWDIAFGPRLNIVNQLAESDYVFHLAGYNGGIAFNTEKCADIFGQNTLMGIQLMDICVQLEHMPKVISLVTSCAYPAKQCAFDKLLYENDYLDGPCDSTVESHGYAKRNVQLASYFYNKQYGLDAICLCPTTVYGPGDSFDPKRSKVTGSLINKFITAKKNNTDVTLWGDGSAKREFIYVEDAVKYILLATLVYDRHDIPLNIGTGQECTIKELAQTIAQLVDFKGKILWDKTKPNGAAGKRLDITRMKQYNILKFEPTPLKEGLKKTIDWYVNTTH